MNVFVLDGKKMTDTATAHSYIARTFKFPSYYGKNLDALADCLSEMGKNTCIVLINKLEFDKNLSKDAKKFLNIFDSLSYEKGFDFVICNDDGTDL